MVFIMDERKPIVFQIDSLMKDVPERKKIIVSNPIAGAFKVTNGDFLCEMSLTQSGVLLTVKNKKGQIEKFSTAISA